MARHRPKYKLPRSRNSSSGFGYWLAAIALLILLGWLWWRQSASPSATQASPAQKTNASPPRPAASLVRTSTPPAIPAPAVRSNSVTMQPAVNPRPSPPGNWPRPPQNVFEAQIALLAWGISSGSLDGVLGSQTRAALSAFQQSQGIPVSGVLDSTTRQTLELDEPPLTSYTVTPNDMARLQPIQPTWLGKSQQPSMDYENLLELVAEKSLTHPGLLRQLNPGVDWAKAAAGTTIQIPNASFPEPGSKAAFIIIRLGQKTLEAFDSGTNLVAHFPCSIARHVEKRPVGELHVTVAISDPNYTFDPEVFPESEEGRTLGRKLVIPPGPNNPVGVAWIGLDKPGYGIHGTPSPEQVGRTESHGCFRLANWNARYLLRLVGVGVPVYVKP